MNDCLLSFSLLIFQAILTELKNVLECLRKRPLFTVIHCHETWQLRCNAAGLPLNSLHFGLWLLPFKSRFSRVVASLLIILTLFNPTMLSGLQTLLIIPNALLSPICSLKFILWYAIFITISLCRAMSLITKTFQCPTGVSSHLFFHC